MSLQFLQAQEECVVTVLYAGNCNNAVIADLYVDSVCKAKNIRHLYYLKGIKDEEVPAYSIKIFGKAFDPDRLVSQKQIVEWKIKDINSELVLIIRNNSLVAKIDIYLFDAKDLEKVEFKNIGNLKSPEPGYEETESTHPYTRKLEIDSKIRFNRDCRVLRKDSFMYILEPLFDYKLYLVSANTGRMLSEISLYDLVPAQDTFTSLLYKKQFEDDKLNWDTIRNYEKMFKGTYRSGFLNIAIEGNRLFITGQHEILAFIDKDKVMTLSYNVVYECDLNLHYKDFYFGRYLSYSGFYPILDVLDHFDTDKIQCQLLTDYDENIKMVRVIYYGLKSNHLLEKTGRDTLLVPEDFKDKFQTNEIRHQFNMGDLSQPVWLLDPYPYFYYPNEGLYFDLINDSVCHRVPFVKRLGGAVTTRHITDKHIVIIYCNQRVFYKIDYDMEHKKILKKLELGRIYEHNLSSSLDMDGRVVYFPAEQEGDNWIYFE